MPASRVRCSSVASLIRCASPAGQLRRRLAQPQVAQPDVAQGGQAADGGGDVVERAHRRVDVEVEHVGDGPSAGASTSSVSAA